MRYPTGVALIWKSSPVWTYQRAAVRGARGRAARGVPDGNRNVAILTHIPFRAAASVRLVGIGRMHTSPAVLARMLDETWILYCAVPTVPTCCAIAVDVGVGFAQALTCVGAYVISANRALCILN